MRIPLLIPSTVLTLALFAGSSAEAQARAAPAPDTTWVARSALYEVFVQDFSPTGDFRGVIAGLDRIKSLGTNVVWLMPIHPVGIKNRKGTLGSRYSVRDYQAIDPSYGTKDDFRALVRAVHERDMKLILDWVPNHTAWDHVWVREHPEYYVRDERGELRVPHDPQGKPTDWTDVAELDYDNPGLRRAMIAAMQYWLEEFGVDGYRVDVAGFVPYDFWREAVPALRAAAKKRILLLAEWGDLEMHRVGYDLTYGWDGYGRLKGVWKGESASVFVQREVADLEAMPRGGMRLRFTTNHDETAWDNPPLTVFGGKPGARAAFVAMALLPGRPLIYNGQEVESPQKLGIFEREAIAWSQPGGDSAQAFYHRVIQLSRADSAFLGSDFRLVGTSAPRDVIAYRRRDVLVLVNARGTSQSLTLQDAKVDGARDLLSGAVQRGDTIRLAPYGALVLRTAPSERRVGGGEVFYHIFVRSFRDSDGDRIGDLRGIQEKLGYLQELGVTSILLTPINPSPFYHNYFGSSFEGVDSEYGDTTSFRNLVQAVHSRGMKIYLDQEIQYVAEDHQWWVQSQGKPGSPYSRFVLYNGPGNTQPESAVFNLTEALIYTGDRIGLATVNLLDVGVREYFQRLFASLADPNGDGRFDDGIDGVRIDHMMDDLDLKGKLTDLFARFWAPVLAGARAVNPAFTIIAEQYDWGYGDDFLTRGGADMVFAFPIRGAIVSLKRQAMADAIGETLRRTPPDKKQLLFIENHDMNRFASSVNSDRSKLRLGAALNILLPGTPLIYYGQEIGMKGTQSTAWKSDANDIPVREAFEWTRRVNGTGAALWYQDTGPWWTNRYAQDNDGVSVEEQGADPNSLLNFYRRLLSLRRERPELEGGETRVIPTNRPDVLVLLRNSGEHASLLLVNLSDSPTTVALPADSLPAGLASAQLKNLLTSGPEPGSLNGRQVRLPPFGVKLLAR